MVTDLQVRRLFRMIRDEQTLSLASAKAGMDEKTARRYRRSGRLPSELKAAHTWRTRPDPFEAIWPEVQALLGAHPGLEAKTLFEDLQRRYSGRFQDGQLRTLQRRVKRWRATEGPGKEVFFDQRYEPGLWCASDFTHLGSLEITIAGAPFDHLLYHFVLPYSNWETGTVCFSESFESLSEGLQSALWELGGVPARHRTDRLSAAVHHMDHPEEFTARYRGLLGHYGLEGRRIQTGQAHENGDVEQRHYRFARALDQALMLRGGRDFADRGDYQRFLGVLFARLNAGRRTRLAEEVSCLRRLPLRRQDAWTRVDVGVGQGSTIRVQKNAYSVESRLIGESVEVKIHAERLEVWFGQRQVEVLPRLRGKGKHHVQYRHVIDSLVRKPGAFENYRYREDLFPSSRFRAVYDGWRRADPSQASREYLKILELAAKESEREVDDALGVLLEGTEPVTVEAVTARMAMKAPAPRTEVRVTSVDLGLYDGLLTAAAIG